MPLPQPKEMARDLSRKCLVTSAFSLCLAADTLPRAIVRLPHASKLESDRLLLSCRYVRRYGVIEYGTPKNMLAHESVEQVPALLPDLVC